MPRPQEREREPVPRRPRCDCEHDGRCSCRPAKARLRCTLHSRWAWLHRCSPSLPQLPQQQPTAWSSQWTWGEEQVCQAGAAPAARLRFPCGPGAWRQKKVVGGLARWRGLRASLRWGCGRVAGMPTRAPPVPEEARASRRGRGSRLSLRGSSRRRQWRRARNPGASSSWWWWW